MKPYKIDLISPIPGCQLNPLCHLLNYHRKQSPTDKISAGSNHTFHKKYHDNCHLNSSIGNRRYAAKTSKEGRGVVNSVSPANSNLHSEHPLSTKWISHEPTAQVFKQKLFQTLPGQKAYLVQVKKKHLFDTLDIFSEVRTMIAWKVVQISKEDIRW